MLELTVAVLLTTVPLATPAFTVAAITAVAVPPGASEANVTVRLLPEPAHVPPFALHEPKVTLDGRLSVMVIELAVPPVLLVTVRK